MKSAYLERFHDFVITASGPKPVDSYRLVGDDGESLSAHVFRTQKQGKEVVVAMRFMVKRRIVEPNRSRLEVAMEDAA